MDRRPRATRAGRVHGARRFVPCGGAKVRRGKDHSVERVLGRCSAIFSLELPRCNATNNRTENGGEGVREGRRRMEEG